jgi:Fe-S-cluster containining protein
MQKSTSRYRRISVARKSLKLTMRADPLVPMSKKPSRSATGKNEPPPQTWMPQVREIYQELAARPLQGNCIGRSTCCRFQLTGKTPYLTRGEALLAAHAWRASGRKNMPASSDGACPFLKNGLCQIYESRPFGCRTHFCDAAGGQTPRHLVRDLIQRLEDIDRALGGDGASHFHSAVSRYL